MLNGEVQQGVAGLVDVDLGFTPASNLLAIRRFDLGIGEATPAPAAYLTFPELRLVRLDQTLPASRHGSLCLCRAHVRL